MKIEQLLMQPRHLSLPIRHLAYRFCVQNQIIGKIHKSEKNIYFLWIIKSNTSGKKLFKLVAWQLNRPLSGKHSGNLFQHVLVFVTIRTAY